jgi:hypothetical protein
MVRIVELDNVKRGSVGIFRVFYLGFNGGALL